MNKLALPVSASYASRENPNSNMLPKLLRLLAEYTMLYSCSLKSMGLYEGRVGCALALFASSRALSDKDLEEHAGILMHEALLANTQDLSLEHGWSGIGFALLLLMEWKMVDLDLNDLWGDYHQRITDYLTKNTKHTQPRDLQYIHYLHAYYRVTHDASSLYLATLIAQRVEAEIKNRYDSCHWAQILSDMTYLELEQYTDWYCYMALLYPDVVSTQFIVEAYDVLDATKLTLRGTYAELVWRQSSGRLDRYVDVNLLMCGFSLRELCNFHELSRFTSFDFDLSRILPLDAEAIATWIWQRIPMRRESCGYGYGVARLLLLLSMVDTPNSIYLA